MKKRNRDFKNPFFFFLVGFAIGLFIKFFPFFFILALLFLAAKLIVFCYSR